MATNFSPCEGSYVLNQFPSNVMFGMNGFHISASVAIQGHHGPLVMCLQNKSFENTMRKEKLLMMSNFSYTQSVFYPFGDFSAISLNLKLLSTNSFEFGRV